MNQHISQGERLTSLLMSAIHILLRGVISNKQTAYLKKKTNKRKWKIDTKHKYIM